MAGRTTLPPWSSIFAYNRKSFRYSKGILLARIYSIFEKAWYESFLNGDSFTIRLPGDIMSLRVFGKVIIVLNTAKATKDLLEKRGDICSDRPVITFYEMYVLQFSSQACRVTSPRMGWQWHVPSARYTESYRLARKLLDRGLRLGAMASFRQMQQARARELLTKLSSNPSNWETHIELSVSPLWTRATCMNCGSAHV